MATWKRYSKDADYSYTLGAFPSFELMQRRPQQVLALLMHPSFQQNEASGRVERFAAERGIPLQVDAKAIGRLSPKENCYLIGVFAKYEDELAAEAPHLVLAQPSNAGNLGTIMRTMLGFGFSNLALLPPAVDIFDPRTVRASMGAVFGLRQAFYTDVNVYQAAHPGHTLYPFMLQGRYDLGKEPVPEGPFSLVFGNEATGLEEGYLKLGHSLVIPHEAAIDSLNLTIAVGIALHHVYRRGYGR